MKIEEFKLLIDTNESLEILEENNEDFIIKNTEIEKKFKIQKNKINEFDELNITAVLNGREAFILDGITRICGYMSKLSNWNKSKRGELEDRRKGNYTI